MIMFITFKGCNTSPRSGSTTGSSSHLRDVILALAQGPPREAAAFSVHTVRGPRMFRILLRGSAAHGKEHESITVLYNTSTNDAR